MTVPDEAAAVPDAPLTTRVPNALLALVPPFVATFGVGAVLDNYVAPELIWGGTDCSVSHGVYACAGYPPTGIVVVLLAVGFVWFHALAWIEGRRGD